MKCGWSILRLTSLMAKTREWNKKVCILLHLAERDFLSAVRTHYPADH